MFDDMRLVQEHHMPDPESSWEEVTKGVGAEFTEVSYSMNSN